MFAGEGAVEGHIHEEREHVVFKKTLDNRKVILQVDKHGTNDGLDYV